MVSAAKPGKSAGRKRSKSSPSHPPFLEMITDAVVTLKERTGSSQYAITKFIEEKQKQLPSNFRKLLLYHLKKLVASGKFLKVKNSFKLPTTRSVPVKSAATKPTAAVKPKPKPKPEVAAKTKKVVAKPKPKPKTTIAVKPNLKSVAAKPKAVAKPKAAVKAKPAKVTRTSTRTSPGKKAAPAAKRKSMMSPGKKAPKPKSVKSPAAKKAPAKKSKK
ncbi:Histone H1.2 [Morella rubra]|uniref:Histone H1.2 n=1 Tax=Morella rubra TaxID=262757 RepID=A0A6A1URD7_9ROSI|nr:Histone H1.2 [Morella rubra]